MAARRGWCPSLFEPMASGDGLIVRIKPRCATLTATQVRAVAAGSHRFGNGVLGVTNRGNLQVRGLTEAAVVPFAAAMAEAGLASDDPGTERRRNVLVSPLVGDDPAVHPRTREIARGVEDVLTYGFVPSPGVGGRDKPGHDDAVSVSIQAVPGKFGIAIDGGGVLPLGLGYADINVVLSGDTCRLVLPDGSFASCPTDDAVAKCRALIGVYVDIAPGERMHDALRRVPAAELFARANLERTGHIDARPAAEPVGFHAYPATTSGAFGVAAPFGRLDAPALANLAHIAERFGDGTLRVSPWRALMIPAVASSQSDAVARACAALGMIVDPADPRLRVVACPGTPACPSATVPTHEDAAFIAAIRHRDLVHVSGCAKGCAHPQAAPVTLAGRDGFYDVIRNGRAGDAPVRAGLTLERAGAWLLEHTA